MASEKQDPLRRGVPIIEDDKGPSLQFIRQWDALRRNTSDDRILDTVGASFVDTATIDFTYDSTAQQVTADVINLSIVEAKLGSSAVTTVKISDDAVTFSKIQNISTDRLVGRDTALEGDLEQIAVGGGIEFTGSSGIQTTSFTGDVTKAAGGTVLTISNGSVSDAKLRDSAALSVIGRSANSTGDPADIAAGTDGHALRRSGTTLGFGTLAAGAFANNTISQTRLAFDQTNVVAGRKSAGAGQGEKIDIGTAGNVLSYLDGVNTHSGSNTFTGSLRAEGSVVLFADDNGADWDPTIITDRNSSSPAAGDLLTRFLFRGRDDAAGVVNYSAFGGQIIDATNGSEDGAIKFITTVAGTLADRMDLEQGLIMEGAAGGDKGVGTINATAVYDDNTLLTCYVFDQEIDKRISLEKWDAKVPDRKLSQEYDPHPEFYEEEEIDKVSGKKRIVTKTRPAKVVEQARTIKRHHAPLRKFLARVGTVYDPLTLDGYAKHWRDKKHLTSMPNEATFDPLQGKLSAGEWVQRLVETVEIQAILIEQLNQRIKKIERSGRVS